MLVTFRPCGPKDHKALLKLIVAYYRFDKIRYDLRSLSRGLDTLLRNLSLGQAWLIENHKHPVGYTLLTYNFDLEYGGMEGMLTEVYVEKRYRNHGVGTLALYEVEDFCRERGIRNQYPGGGGYAGMVYDIAYGRAMLQSALLLK